MDFAPVLIFLFLYYVRPHDWLPVLNLAKPITVTMAWALGSMFMRAGGFTVRALVSTPLQWGMLIYLTYIFTTAKDLQTTFEGAKSAFIFFMVTFMALSSMERLE